MKSIISGNGGACSASTMAVFCLLRLAIQTAPRRQMAPITPRATPTATPTEAPVVSPLEEEELDVEDDTDEVVLDVMD